MHTYTTTTTSRPTAGSKRGRLLGGTLWVLQVMWGLFFAGSGFGKVLLFDATLYAEAPRAVAWYAAVPQWLIVCIGVCEVLGGVGLILPSVTRVRPALTPLAGAGLALTMLLAAAFHVARGEYALVPANLVLGLVSAFLAAGRSRLRPIGSGPLTTRRALTAAAVLVAMVALVFVPTWYTMTHTQF